MALSDLLDRIGLAAFRQGNTIFQSRNIGRAHPRIRELIAHHAHTGKVTPSIEVCWTCVSHSGGGGGGDWVDTQTITTGTGYNPYDGATCDVWANVTNSWAYYGSTVDEQGYGAYAGPDYYYSTPKVQPAACAVAAGTFIQAAQQAAKYMVANSWTFSGTMIKVGASSLAATVFASNFAAAGAAVTIDSALAFLAALLAFLTVPEWGILVAAVAALLLVGGSLAICAGLA